jgi:hypothetical protein
MCRSPIDVPNQARNSLVFQIYLGRPIFQSIEHEVASLGGAEDLMEKRFEESDRRDPEDRLIDEDDLRERKDKMMDKTIADTFPASDPPSSLPDPEEDSFAARAA